MVSFFLLSFLPRDVLDGIWDLIESVYEGFPIYSLFITKCIEKRAHFRFECFFFNVRTDGLLV